MIEQCWIEWRILNLSKIWRFVGFATCFGVEKLLKVWEGFCEAFSRLSVQIVSIGTGKREAGILHSLVRNCCADGKFIFT